MIKCTVDSVCRRVHRGWGSQRTAGSKQARPAVTRIRVDRCLPQTARYLRSPHHSGREVKPNDKHGVAYGTEGRCADQSPGVPLLHVAGQGDIAVDHYRPNGEQNEKAEAQKPFPPRPPWHRQQRPLPANTRRKESGGNPDTSLMRNRCHIQHSKAPTGVSYTVTSCVSGSRCLKNTTCMEGRSDRGEQLGETVWWAEQQRTIGRHATSPHPAHTHIDRLPFGDADTRGCRQCTPGQFRTERAAPDLRRQGSWISS